MELRQTTAVMGQQSRRQSSSLPTLQQHEGEKNPTHGSDKAARSSDCSVLVLPLCFLGPSPAANPSLTWEKCVSAAAVHVTALCLRFPRWNNMTSPRLQRAGGCREESVQEFAGRTSTRMQGTGEKKKGTENKTVSVQENYWACVWVPSTLAT